ncbi:MAG TPA: TIGR03936 family radical SAM-associated protein [Methylomusa anaerophila]|uniref:DUF2344 domain-containing protein n=1 Tax=Methylomusa anaerophila TaxID=1930071 RepID=A0A348AF96_9FIRM|nr:TIGR03936 family radical SAM-associated protein [Methylomusa anaerophila]BBB89744.1 hypothetical protein MAMMFC1_00378 [Methylomusa anaerophila]HML89210.1 TIGR03936 family radical SAM-associated protein [Methylomusa anaerophila]
MAKLRLEITKGEAIRYISHLDYAGTIERALRRAKLPVSYSEGFNPHMKLAFASALAVGVTSLAEYMDVELTGELDLQEIKNRLEPMLPAGISFNEAKYIEKHSPALMAIVNLAAYRVVAPLSNGEDREKVTNCIRQFNSASCVPYTKESPKGRREIDIKEFMGEDVRISGDNLLTDSVSLDVALRITPQGSVKPSELVDALIISFGLPVKKDAVLIERTGLFVTDGMLRFSPLKM